MIRLIPYFALLVAAATGLAWLADRPGSLTVDWLGYNVHMSAFLAATLLVFFLAIFGLAIWLGVLALTAPRRFARWVAHRRARIGQEALRRGIFAAASGDRLGALKARAIAKKALPEDPLTLLLEAQAAQLNDDRIASRQAFERMLENPEMAELGLRGLYFEAKKAEEFEAAKQFAERALVANPALAWSSSALFEMQCREGDWQAGLRTLAIAKEHRHLNRAEADRRRALLLTQLAIELEDTQQGKALAYALEATGLAPSLVPAAVVAGRVLASQGSTVRALKVLTQAWRSSQHPDIALIYAHARTGDSPRDRLGRVKALVSTAPATMEGDIAVAVAAIEAQDWAAARSALQPHLAATPPARICRLMARIEAGENRDAGRAREWMARAARGAPDPMWVASDGSVSSEWRATSPATGQLALFEWKTPHGAEAAIDADFVPESDLSESEADAAPAVEAAAPAGKGSELLVLSQSVPKPREQETGTTRPPQSASPSLPASDSRNRLITADANREKSQTDRSPSTAPNGHDEEVASPVPSAKPKPQPRKPTIFVPGPAPDDPGPRTAETEDDSTPLSRYRDPS